MPHLLNRMLGGFALSAVVTLVAGAAFAAEGRLYPSGPPNGVAYLRFVNLAAADVRVLHEGLVEYFRSGRMSLLEEYSSRALRRVWKATRFSWWFTSVMHKLSSEEFAAKLQHAELDYLSRSESASRSLAESYVGLYA